MVLHMGKCIRARSLDEIRTPSPQQIRGLIPRDSRHWGTKHLSFVVALAGRFTGASLA